MPSKRKNTDASTRKLTLRKKPTQLSTPCDLTPTESSQQTSFTSLLKMKLDKVRSTHKSDDDFEEVGQSFEGKEVPKSGGKLRKEERRLLPNPVRGISIATWLKWWRAATQVKSSSLNKHRKGNDSRTTPSRPLGTKSSASLFLLAKFSSRIWLQ